MSSSGFKQVRHPNARVELAGFPLKNDWRIWRIEGNGTSNSKGFCCFLKSSNPPIVLMEKAVQL
jgi:hypothetical protein